ncbi:MAG: papain-like cysteine protease family protein [Bacteroidales bacterium]
MKTSSLFRMIVPIVMVTILQGTTIAQMVGIKKIEFQKHYRFQKDAMWCWATSAEMVLSYEGILLKQEEIVRHIKGGVYSMTGSIFDMIRVTNCILKDSMENNTILSGQYIIGAPYPNVLFNQLKNKRPVILNYNSGHAIGHAIVLTGIDYVKNPDNTITITKCYIFDPFSYAQSYDILGKPFLKADSSLSYKEYFLQMDKLGNVQLLSSSGFVGIISGVILIDAAYI